MKIKKANVDLCWTRAQGASGQDRDLLTFVDQHERWLLAWSRVSKAGALSTVSLIWINPEIAVVNGVVAILAAKYLWGKANQALSKMGEIEHSKYREGIEEEKLSKAKVLKNFSPSSSVTTRVSSSPKQAEKG